MLRARFRRANLVVVCRNIKTLFNFEPPATEEEIQAASLQFVRKLSGFTRPSQTNREAFDSAVVRITKIASELLETLKTDSAPRDRDVEAMKAKIRSAKRFGVA